MIRFINLLFLVTISFESLAVLLIGIPDSEVDEGKKESPQQVRSDEHKMLYPLPSMYLRYMKKQWKVVKPRFVKRAKKVQEVIPSMNILVPPFKSESDKGLERTKKKTEQKYSGNMKRLRDGGRASLVFQNLSDLEQGYNLLKKSPEFEIIYVKNKFKTNKLGEYMDVNMNLQDKETKYIFEVQLHLCHILNTKAKAHKESYEPIRIMEGKAKSENRPLTQDEERVKAELIDKFKLQYKQDIMDAENGVACILKSKKYLIEPEALPTSKSTTIPSKDIGDSSSKRLNVQVNIWPSISKILDLRIDYKIFNKLALGGIFKTYKWHNANTGNSIGINLNYTLKNSGIFTSGWYINTYFVRNKYRTPKSGTKFIGITNKAFKDYDATGLLIGYQFFQKHGINFKIAGGAEYDFTAVNYINDKSTKLVPLVELIFGFAIF